MDEDQKETKTQEWKEARKNLRVSSIQAIEKAVVVFCGKAMKERSKVQLNFELACGNAALTGASGYSGASPTLNTTIGSSRSVYGSEVSFKVKSRLSLTEEECRSSGVLGAHSAPYFHTNRRRLLCKTSSNPGPQPRTALAGARLLTHYIVIALSNTRSLGIIALSSLADHTAWTRASKFTMQ